QRTTRNERSKSKSNGIGRSGNGSGNSKSSGKAGAIAASITITGLTAQADEERGRASKMRGHLFIAGMFNTAALSALFISSIGWRCHQGYMDASDGYATDAPPELRGLVNDNDDDNDDDDGELSFATKSLAVKDVASSKGSSGGDGGGDGDDLVPSYLKWDASPANVPPDWSFVTPSGCPNTTQFRVLGDQKIIVHYHMQHNAGTAFCSSVRRFVPCATRACHQMSKHCMVSNNEEVEADNIRRNYEEHGVQYVSYEMMLPPRFPLPFVSDTARRNLYFTTIVRDPFKRMLSWFRNAYLKKGKALDASMMSPFWMDLTGKTGIYLGENLNAQWLSGAQTRVSGDHVNTAKCRLQLFDLVIADKLYDHALQKVICPLNGWKDKGVCNGQIPKAEHKSYSKSDPLKNGTDPLLIGAWVERLRPSFEIYDYARILSWKQLKEHGVEDLPELSELPSYMDTLTKYAGVKMTQLKRITPVTLENEDYFAPPREFCNRMKQIWTSNPDGECRKSVSLHKCLESVTNSMLRYFLEYTLMTSRSTECLGYRDN
ncbi:hypothetical protein ACHAWF_008813, partial [Thalassiosira exigua]